MLPKTDMLEGEVIWRPKDTLAEVTFPPHNATEYIEHAQLLAMDFSEYAHSRRSSQWTESG